MENNNLNVTMEDYTQEQEKESQCNDDYIFRLGLVKGLKQVVKKFNFNSYDLIDAIFGEEYVTYQQIILNIQKTKKSDMIICYGNNHPVLKVFLNEILNQQKKFNKINYKTLTFNGYIHNSEDYILKKICKLITGSEVVSGHDNYIRILENYDYDEGEFFVIYFENFEQIFSKKKQVLLYTILEFVSKSRNILVCGFTSNYNLIDMMEKRNRSRFSHKTVHITIPSIEKVINGLEKSFVQTEDSNANCRTPVEIFFSLLISDKTESFLMLIHKYIDLGMSIYEILTRVKRILAMIVYHIENKMNKSVFISKEAIQSIINGVTFEIKEEETQGSYFTLLKNLPKVHITLLICLCISCSKFKDKITLSMIYQEYIKFVLPKQREGVHRTKLDLIIAKKVLEELATLNLINIRADDRYVNVYELKLPLAETKNAIINLYKINKLDTDMQSLINLV